MRQLQEAAKKLGDLNVPGSGPWGSLHGMQQVFNQEFWQNFHQLTSMEQNQTEHRHPTTSRPTQGASKPKKDSLAGKPDISPRLDLFETLSRIIITVELPGLDRNSLKLSVSDGTVLKFMGKFKKHDLSAYLIQQERTYGKFSRNIILPSSVLPENIKTTYKDGLLEIHLIKRNTQQTSEVRTTTNEVSIFLSEDHPCSDNS